MKKFIAALLIVPFLAFVAPEWVAVKLDESVTVSFPAKPDEKDMSGNPVWVKDLDNGARCMAMVVDFAKFGMDSAGLAAEIERDAAFEEFKQGVMGQIQGSSLISEKRGKVAGKTYFEYVIDMGKGDQPEALNVMYSRNIFSNGKMYTMTFYEKNKQPHDADRNKYFDSFKSKS